MPAAAYYPTRRRRKGGGRPRPGLADKLGKYFSQEFIKTSLPFGQPLVRYYKYANNFTGELKKEIKIGLANQIFYSAIGPAFRKHPLFGLYQFSQNAPKKIFFIAWNDIIQGGWWYKHLGYERRALTGATERLFDERAGRVVTRLRRDRWKVPKVREVWVPREHLGLGPFRRDLGPRGLRMARFFRDLDAAINPVGWLRGETFAHFGWEKGHFDAGGNFVAGANLRGRPPGWEGLERVDYSFSFGPGTVRNIPFVSPVARGLAAVRAYLFGDLKTLEKIGWGKGPTIVSKQVYKETFLKRVLSLGRVKKFGVRDWSLRVPNSGRLAKASRLLYYANPRYLIPNIITGQAFADWGWRQEALKVGQLPGLVGPAGHLYEGLVPGGGRLRILRDGAGALAGQVRGGSYYRPRAGVLTIGSRSIPLGRLGRFFYYLHPRQLLLNGETWRVLGWRPQLVGPSGKVVRWVERGGRLGRIGRGLHRVHPVGGAGRQLKAGKSAVDAFFRKTAQTLTAWLAGTRLGKLLAKLAKRPLVQKILGSGLIRRIFGNKVLKFLAKKAFRGSFELLKWGLAPQAQVLNYSFKGARFAAKNLFRGGKAAVKALYRLGRKIVGRLIQTATSAAVKSAATSALVAVKGFIVGTVVPALVSAAGAAISAAGTLVGGAAAAVGVSAAAVVVAVAAALAAIVIIAVVILLFILPGSLKYTAEAGLGIGAVAIEKTARVEANEKYQTDKIGGNYLDVDSREHTIEYILTVKNNSEDMKIISLTATDDNATPAAGDDLTFSFPPAASPSATIAPGESVELKRYGRQVVAAAARTVVNKVEGTAELVGISDPSETAGASFSDIGIFMIGTSPGADTPCGWPTAGWVAAIFGQDMDVGPEKKHSGVDIVSLDPTAGQEVAATLHGFLARSYWNDNFGGLIRIKHPTGEFYIDFIHMNEATVNDLGGQLGKEFNWGDLVGETYVGALPYSTVTHLHYRVRQKNAAGGYDNVDPMNYANRKSVGDTVAAGEGCGHP